MHVHNVNTAIHLDATQLSGCKSDLVQDMLIHDIAALPSVMQKSVYSAITIPFAESDMHAWCDPWFWFSWSWHA